MGYTPPARFPNKKDTAGAVEKLYELRRNSFSIETLEWLAKAVIAISTVLVTLGLCVAAFTHWTGVGLGLGLGVALIGVGLGFCAKKLQECTYTGSQEKLLAMAGTKTLESHIQDIQLHARKRHRDDASSDAESNASGSESRSVAS